MAAPVSAAFTGRSGVRVGMYERIKVRYLTFRSILDGQTDAAFFPHYQPRRNSMNKCGRSVSDRSTFLTFCGPKAVLFFTPLNILWRDISCFIDEQRQV